MTEVWWDSEAAMFAALATPGGQAASAILADDEVKCTDSKRLSAFLATEEVIFDLTN